MDAQAQNQEQNQESTVIPHASTFYANASNTNTEVQSCKEQTALISSSLEKLKTESSVSIKLDTPLSRELFSNLVGKGYCVETQDYCTYTNGKLNKEHYVTVSLPQARSTFYMYPRYSRWPRSFWSGGMLDWF